jgi:16S rRNA processing protein RimM
VPSDDGLIELGAVVRSHGLRGELLVKPFNPASELWDGLKELELKLPDGRIERHPVEDVREHSGSLLLALERIRDRTHGDSYKGSLVCVRRSELPALDEGEYYLADLVGLAARDEAGKELGRVVDLVQYPSVCCLVLATEEGTREVPDLERYVLEVHVADGYVVVAHLDELELVKPAR